MSGAAEPSSTVCASASFPTAIAPRAQGARVHVRYTRSSPESKLPGEQRRGARTTAHPSPAPSPLVEYEPADRLSAADALKHPFVLAAASAMVAPEVAPPLVSRVVRLPQRRQAGGRVVRRRVVAITPRLSPVSLR